MVNRKDFLKKRFNTGFLNEKSGYPLSLKKCLKSNLKNCQIYGNSIQDGIPTPDNPIEVKSLGENSKNLVNYKSFVNSFGPPVTIIDNGVIVSGTYGIKINFKNNLPPGAYCCSWMREVISGTPDQNIWRVQYEDDNFSPSRLNGLSITAVQPIKSLWLYSSFGGQNFTVKYTDIKFEKGDTATPYKPYSYVDIENIGENLFNPLNVGKRLSQGKLINSNNVVTSDYINVKKYNYICANQAGSYAFYSEKNEASIISYEDKTFQNMFRCYKTPSNAVYVRLTSPLNVNIMAVGSNESVSSISGYVKYKEPITTTIDLTGHEPLKKIGEYADYIDYENSRIVRNIKKVVFTENTIFNTNFVETYGELVHDLPENERVSTNAKDSAISTNFVNVKSGNALGSALSINLPKNGYDKKTFSIDEFKTFLKEQYDNGTPVTVYYVLKTQAYEPIDLPKIKLERMSNNITAYDEDLQASNIKVKYRSKKKEGI